MSTLSERWNEYRLKEFQELDRRANVTAFWEARLREAFYAGAEMVIEKMESSHEKDGMQAELDHFKNRPR